MPIVCPLVFRSMLVATLSVAPQLAEAANQVVTNCSNDVELRSDLAAMQAGDGGLLTFSCSTATIVLTADTPTISKATTIDGGGKITISGGNSRRIFVVDGGAQLTLKSVVLTNGSTSGDGGAIASFGGLVLQHVRIRDSSASLGGGALVTYGSTQIDDSEIDSNAAQNGGGLYARFPEAPVTIRRSNFHDNQANGFSGNGDGGAVFLDGAALTIEDSEIYNNSADGSGGGIHNEFASSSITVRRSWIHDNVATGGGGGVWAVSGPLAILDSTVSGNSTPFRGGGIAYNLGASATIDGTTIHDNYAELSGGGMFVQNSTGVELTNSTVSSNESSGTAGLTSAGSNVSVLHVTFALNSSSGVAAGGIGHFAGGERNATVINSLFADNDPVDCQVNSGVMSSGGGNVASDGSCSAVFNKASDRNTADVQLGPLGMNGGPTFTHVPGPGSDAVDAGVTASAPPDDQRGVVRPQGASADAGSVEVAACSAGAALCGDANGNQNIAASDALKTLQFAVGSIASCERWLCDYDGNGSISAADALGILRAAVGQQTMPKCPPKWDCQSVQG